MTIMVAAKYKVTRNIYSESRMSSDNQDSTIHIMSVALSEDKALIFGRMLLELKQRIVSELGNNLGNGGA